MAPPYTQQTSSVLYKLLPSMSHCFGTSCVLCVHEGRLRYSEILWRKGSNLSLDFLRACKYGLSMPDTAAWSFNALKAQFCSTLRCEPRTKGFDSCCLQHSTLALLKEMLFTLDIAVDCGNSADRAAADRLQRKCDFLTLGIAAHCISLPCSWFCFPKKSNQTKYTSKLISPMSKTADQHCIEFE